MPCSTDWPCACARLTNFEREATSARVTGRRYARGASVDKILSTQAGPDLGSQRRSFLRLARSTVEGNGPMKRIEFRYLFFLLLYASLSVSDLTNGSSTNAARKVWSPSGRYSLNSSSEYG